MPRAHLLRVLKRLAVARIIVADLLWGRIIMLRKALQRQRDIAYLPLLWLPVGLFVRLVIGLQFLICHGHLGLELRWGQQHIPHRSPLIVATIGLFDLSVSDMDPRRKEVGDLLQQEDLLLFGLKLARRHGWHLAAQDELIAGWAELSLLLERSDAGDGIVQLLLGHYDTVLLGHAQEDGPRRQLFQSHLPEVEAFVEVHLRLGTEDSTIALLQRIIGALEVAHVDRLAKNRRHFRACQITA